MHVQACVETHTCIFMECIVSGWVHVAAYSCCSSCGQWCFTLFVLEQLVTRFGLLVVSVEGMEVMLADGS